MSSFVFVREIKPVNEMTREELIDALVDESIHYLRNEMHYQDTNVLDSYLRGGFKGFENFSMEELVEEYGYAFGADDDAEYEDER
jgi:hypothetical protein